MSQSAFPRETLSPAGGLPFMAASIDVRVYSDYV
jgi:hypothetical protein